MKNGKDKKYNVINTNKKFSIAPITIPIIFDGIESIIVALNIFSTIPVKKVTSLRIPYNIPNITMNAITSYKSIFIDVTPLITPKN